MSTESTMVRSDKTAREIFEELTANPARARFGFGEKLAVVNVDPQKTYTRPDLYPNTGYVADPKQVDYMRELSNAARAKGLPVVWTHVGYMPNSSDAGIWGTRTDTPDSLQNIKRGSDRHRFDERLEIDEEVDAVYTKRMPSAFFETPLSSFLTWHKVDTLVVTGGLDFRLRARHRCRLALPRLPDDRPHGVRRRQARELPLRQPDRHAAQVRRRGGNRRGHGVGRGLRGREMIAGDPNLYDYWPYRDRPKIVWPGGKKLAFWVAPNIEYYEFNPPRNPKRPGWPRPSPDVVGYSQRDYGNRVGHWRLMELMDKYGVRGSISLNVAMCDHCPEIIEACNERDWEFFSHGIYNTRYSYEMDEAQERAVLEDSIRTVEAATGQRIRGYLAPALTHTERTLDLIAEYDFWYTCDLFQDDQPQPIKTTSGKLISMPYSLEVNDVITYGALAMDPWRYAEALKRQLDQLLEEGEESGTVMCIPLHAYLVAQPHRLRAFEEALKHADANRDDVWITTAVEIAAYYREHYWDQTLADVAGRGLASGGTGFAPEAAA